MKTDLQIGDIVEIKKLTKSEQDQLTSEELMFYLAHENELFSLFSIKNEYATLLFMDLKIEHYPLQFLDLYKRPDYELDYKDI